MDGGCVNSLKRFDGIEVSSVEGELNEIIGVVIDG